MTPPVSAAPQAPAKPGASAPAAGGVPRRTFLQRVATGWAAFTAASLAMLAAMGRFMFPNDLFEPPTKFKIGRPEEYAVGVVDERWKAERKIWVIREKQGIYVLSTVCTHLGCTPNWLQADNKFKCPCHGSGFYMTGQNFEGPAPRPLERFKVGFAADGQIEVDKSRKFQKELGQWSDPDAYLDFVG